MASLSSYGGKLSSNGLLSSNGGRLSNFGSGAPAAVTTDFSYAQFEGGQAGILDTARIGTRTYWAAGGRTVWAGEITGTEALFSAVISSGSLATGNIVVSVDDAAATNAVYENDKFTLFTGLTDTTHKIVISGGAAVGAGIGVTNTGTILTVTGASPAVSVGDTMLNMFDGNALTVSAGPSIDIAAPYAGLYVPAKIPPGSNHYMSAYKFKTDAARLVVINSSNRYIYLSTDGAAPIRYDKGILPTISMYAIELDGLMHTYKLWSYDKAVRANVGLLSINLFGALSDVGVTHRLEQFGDSITEGSSGGVTDRGEVETMPVAMHFGRIGTTYGISGETVAGLKARLPALLANISPTVNDVAVLAAGRNNVGVAWTPEVEDDYSSCIDQLIAVYGKVICRGIIPGGSILPPQTTIYTTENAGIAGIVAAKANPNIVYVDPNGWTDLITYDNIHPTDAGYDILETHCKTAYAPYL
jgi:lysophospholipase L1-like esterase